MRAEVCVCVCIAGSGCEAEEDSELEDWGSGSSGRQEAWDPDVMPVSALEDSLLFESKINNGAYVASFFVFDVHIRCSGLHPTVWDH